MIVRDDGGVGWFFFFFFFGKDLGFGDGKNRNISTVSYEHAYALKNYHSSMRNSLEMNGHECTNKKKKKTHTYTCLCS